MAAPNAKPPPAEPSGGLIESVVAAQFDELDNTPGSDLLQARYCETLPLCLIADALLEKIERSWICKEPLHIDGFDLLQLSDGYLPIWLADAPRIYASTILVGRAIRDAFRAEGLKPPTIFVEQADGR